MTVYFLDATGLMRQMVATTIDIDAEPGSWREVCKRCDGRGWTCEAHPDQPFEHEHDGKVCAGPGDPCPDCNELARK